MVIFGLISAAVGTRIALGAEPLSPAASAHNPVIWADVPDPSVVRVGDFYYMSSTTMHMCPGLPIMKSKDLVNWRMASYAYETLADNEALRLENGKDAYGQRLLGQQPAFPRRRVLCLDFLRHQRTHPHLHHARSGARPVERDEFRARDG